MTRAEMIVIITREVKGLSTYLATADYEDACDDAARETGWAFPVSTDFKIFWQKQRSVRHIFFHLFTESTYKFKYKQIHLNQRFEHLKDALEMMDLAYEKILEERPDEFANASAFELFGHKVDAGFAYEPQTGRDFTYDEDQLVIVAPNEKS